MADVNYKLKYMELKSKFINSVDTAFRLGVEQGMQNAQVQQAQQQAADAQAQAEAAAQGQPGDGSGDPQGIPGDPGQAGPESEHPEGSELDQHINQLETAMGKAEKDSELFITLKKTVDGMKHTQMLRKNESAIRAIAKNMAKKPSVVPPRTMNERARKNLSDNHKATLELQQQIVDDVFKHWDAEESDMMGKVLEIVGNEGKLKKD